MPNWIPTLFLCAAPLSCYAQLAPEARNAIDEAVRKALADTGTASASIAVVKDAKLAYAQAYGDARLDPKAPATAAMRYKIGSNSKQLTAASILLLAEDGKLSLDDKVSRFFPDLTRARDISIRQLLSHTSGYQDYYPLDYVAPFMARDITPPGILDTWAKKPLDFEPGAQWQYSNTNYVIAGLILEKITGKPPFDLLRSRVFERLGMRSPVDADRNRWDTADPAGYTRFALGPARPVQPEGQGWLYAAGEVAMTASDLALWDISLMNGTILKPASMKALTTEVLLKNGTGAGYALGLDVSNRRGHRRWSHGGGTAGFFSRNATFPDDKIAITVLTNQESPGAARIAQKLEEILLASAQDPKAAAALDAARRIFADLQDGKIDRSQFHEDAIAYFTEQVRADFAASLHPLGAPTSFAQTGMSERGGMITRTFAIQTRTASLSLSTYAMPDGRFTQYLIYPGGER